MQKPVPSAPCYYACDEGFIWRNGRRLKAQMDKLGYRRMKTSIHNVQTTRSIHRMVCEAWHGKCPEGDYMCRHKDGNPRNNRPDNLAWSTRAENEADKERHGTLLWGDKATNRVLSSEIVLEARRRCTNREQIKDVAAELGVSDRVLADAVTGRRWKRLPGAIVPYSTKRKLTDEQVLQIRARSSENRHKLAAEFGISQNAIFQVVRRITYTHL